MAHAILSAANRVGSWPRCTLLVLAGIGWVLLWGLPTLILPLATDQVMFALGARTILDGGHLYVDFWDIKPPLIYLLYALPFAVAGEHAEAIRVFDLANTLLGMGAIFLAARRFFTDRAAVIGAAFFGFAYLTWAGVDGLAEVETFVTAPLLLAFAVYLPVDDDRSASVRAVGAGALLSLTILLKLPAVLFVLGLPAAELLLRNEASWSVRGAIRRLSLAGIAFVLMLGIVAGYLAAGGALDDYIDIQRHYTAPYSRFHGSPEGLSHSRFVFLATGNLLRSTAFIVVPAALALLLAVRDGARTRAAYLFGFLAVAAVVAIWWQGKMFRYHWLLLLPVLSPLAGYSVDRALSMLGGMGARATLGTAALMFAFIGAFASEPLLNTYDGYRTLLDYADDSITLREVEARSLPLLRMNHDLVDYVQREGEPGDALFVWGFWPVTQFWLDGPVVSRFVVNNALRATWTPESWRLELVEDLREQPPRFFAVARNDDQIWLAGSRDTSEDYIRDDFPELLTFLQDEYAFSQDMGLFLLFERLPSAQRGQGLGDMGPLGGSLAPEPLEEAPTGGISLPEGFSATVVADGFSQPTSLALGPDGGVYLSQRGGPVFRLVDEDGDGVFEDRYTYTPDISGIHGIVFAPDGETLYVSSVGRVSAVRDTDGDTVTDFVDDIIVGLPHGRHENNGLAFGPDGLLYITNGSTCNDCEEENPHSAVILQANPDGTGLRVYASGLRNSYDLVFDPVGRLWATDNGVDPPCNTIDELNLIEEGGDYGWPYGPECDSLSSPIVPVGDLGFNTASTGIDYYNDNQFPKEYRGNFFITLWGSLGYAPVPGGRILVRAIIRESDNGPVATIKQFATGLDRPIDVVVDKDGTLLVLDFGSGLLYRIVYDA